MTKRFFALLLFFLISLSSWGNDLSLTVRSDSLKSDSASDRTITAFPILFYLPETSLSFGALGIATFNIGKEKSWRPSQFSLSFAYTLKNQLLIFTPYELYYKQRWKMDGELGYYRYFYNYYGIGNNSEKDNLESFDANFPRVINNLSYRYSSSNFVGVRTRFDGFKIQNPDSLLKLDSPTGVSGGNVFTAGLIYSIDTRNNIFYPKKGVFLNFISEFSSKRIISDFDFSLFQVSVSHYKEIKANHILALNLTTGTILGDAPFFMNYYLSSSKVARRFADRRFIDQNLFVAQAEYRFPIKNRIRGALFGALGNVANTYSNIFSNTPKLSGGLGLRLQLNKKILNHIRLDVAGNKEGVQFYITFGEAF